MADAVTFNPGELHLQTISGVDKKVAALAPHLITDHVPDAHRNFYSNLNMVFVGSVDESGQPWASVICGPKGFVDATDKKRVKIITKPIEGDPLIKNIYNKSEIGLLGLEFETRRRNRVNGQIAKIDNDGFSVEVKKAFGNCPKYIQTRDIKTFTVNSNNTSRDTIEVFDCIDEEIKQKISSVNTFFMASYYPNEEHRGVDVSHRGGKEGFVKVLDDKTFGFDDYAGNNVYMTLGNLYSNPVVGLLFIDFDSGDVMQLACSSEIIETPNDRHARRIILTLKKGQILRQALSIESEFIDYSPFV